MMTHVLSASRSGFRPILMKIPLSRRTSTALGKRTARQQRGDGHEQRNGYPDHEPHATERQLKQEEREVKNSLSE